MTGGLGVLYSGVPAVTLPGEDFSSRVLASMLVFHGAAATPTTILLLRIKHPSCAGAAATVARTPPPAPPAPREPFPAQPPQSQARRGALHSDRRLQRRSPPPNHRAAFTARCNNSLFVLAHRCCCRRHGRRARALATGMRCDSPNVGSERRCEMHGYRRPLLPRHLQLLLVALPLWSISCTFGEPNPVLVTKCLHLMRSAAVASEIDPPYLNVNNLNTTGIFTTGRNCALNVTAPADSARCHPPPSTPAPPHTMSLAAAR
jgi:hypothetical protein